LTEVFYTPYGVNRKLAPDIESLQNLQKFVLALFSIECAKMKKAPPNMVRPSYFQTIRRGESEKTV